MKGLLRAGRTSTLAVLVILILWLAIWLGVLVETTLALRTLWLLLALLPLLLVAFAVGYNAKSGYAWSGFLSLAYLAQGIAVAWAGAAHAWVGAIEIFLSVLLFAAASGALRARRHAA